MQKTTNIFITDSDYSCTDKSFEYLLWFQPTLGWMVLNNDEIFIILDWRYFEKTKNINIEQIRKITWKNDLIVTFIKTLDLIGDIIKIIKNGNNLDSKKSENNKVVFEWKIAGEYIEKIENSMLEINNEKIEIEILKWWYFLKNRIIKNIQEKNNIKEAIKIIDKVFVYITELNSKWEIKWKTEFEIRWIIISKIFEFGWEWESFDSIVAFGKNSSIPHHKTWNTLIWDWVLLIDMWALFNWYCSDFTRTFWVWEKNEEYNNFIKVYEIVKNAHNNAFINSKSWMSWKDIDYLTRWYIEEKGYWEKYIHWTGHWVWLDIHEAPWINSKSENIIENDMIFTIEPWIYLKDNFGIRLEDIVIMEDGRLIKYSEVEI